MKITILCTDPDHPVIIYLQEWQKRLSIMGHEIQLIHDKKNLTGGDILFLVSCSQLITEADRKNFGAALVLHASDLPRGRGWSPHIWTIVSGDNDITVSLLEVDKPVDSGSIWLKKKVTLEGHELYREINALLFQTEIELMTQAVKQYDNIKPQPQIGEPGDYLPKRTPEDSRLDPYKSIADQFDLLRVADPERYPAFIDYADNRYTLKIEKVTSDDK